MPSALSEEVVLFPESLLTAAAHPDPYPYYAALLAYCPFYREHRLGLWVALGAREVSEILSSQALRVRPPAEPVPAAIAGAPAGEIFKNLVRMNDGPRHAQAKAAVGACLAAFDAAQIDAVARRDAAELARTVGVQHRQELDLFNFALPVRVVAQMIGLPEDIAGRCAALIGDFVRCLSPLSGPDEIAQSNKAAESLLQQLRDAWRPNSGLAAHAERLRNDGLGEREAVLANLVGFMSQTYEATAGLIGNTLLALANHPHLRRRVADDDALLQRVIEEVARYDSPAHNTRRFVAEDCVIAGEAMKQSDQILVVLAAANRDPAHCERPHVFDPDRADRRSFTFGAGRHACAGQAIATTIAAAGIQALMAHGLDIAALAGPVEYRRSVNSRIPLFGGAA
jgi:cytochrome P450